MTSPEYTPLDSLKEAYHVVRNLIEIAQEQICEEFDDESSAQRLLDAAQAELVSAIARHVPGIALDSLGLLEQTLQGHLDINTYDDGTLISIPIDAGEPHGVVATYYPRRDGSRWAFEERLRADARRIYAERVAYEAAHPAEV